MIKEYVNQAGYRIRASEKAYNLLYKKNGFVPADAGANSREGEQENVPSRSGEEINDLPDPATGGEDSGGKTRRASAGKKASGGKSRRAAADQDTTGQPEGDREQAGYEKVSPDAGNADGAITTQDATALAAEPREDK